jgi:hypothetical protein
MVTGHAKDSFEGIFQKAVRSRISKQSDDTCEIELLPPSAINATTEEHAVILTVSSIVFRLLLVFHFNEDESTREYFVNEGSEASLQEVLLEVFNLTCGALNQELLQYFPDLGMSTPYVLSARCLPHLLGLKPDLLSSYAITINSQVRLAATLCVCAHAPVDFIADLSAVEESSGELELF